MQYQNYLGCAALVVALGQGACADITQPDSSQDAADSGGAGSAASSGSVDAAAGAAGSSDTTTSTDTKVVKTGAGTVQSVTFDVTTVAQGGKYAPKNIGAIWIEDESGAYVRSIEVWAGIRKRDLRQYVSKLGGRKDTDVTTSATLRAHRAHEVTWDLKDSSGAVVPAGAYKLYVEVTDREGAGQTYSVAFDTSQGTQIITPAGSSYYNSMSLKLE